MTIKNNKNIHNINNNDVCNDDDYDNGYYYYYINAKQINHTNINKNKIIINNDQIKHV